MTDTGGGFATAACGQNPEFSAKSVRIPMVVSVFPDELYLPTRNWAEKAYPPFVHFNKLENGGHLPAWQQPEAFSIEVRASFRSLRSVWHFQPDVT